MKKLILLVTVFLLFGCNSSQDQNLVGKYYDTNGRLTINIKPNNIINDTTPGDVNYQKTGNVITYMPPGAPKTVALTIQPDGTLLLFGTYVLTKK